MTNKAKQRATRRIGRLIFISAAATLVFGAATLAWFIGLRTVNVSTFDVEIAGTDSLALSLDGATWDTTITISESTLEAVSYSGHTNSWGGEGLVPVSTIGAMDSTVSRMKLYEKASLTATPGGYRLMASRVLNYDANPEQDGYVVFDLFVRNLSGTQYLTALNTADEEAIYLTVDSSVTVATDGVEDTGIENSVRVAFTQIGRVIATTDVAATITGITCTTGGSVTGICRDAQIWEPNDRDHVANAISWYDTSCLARTGADLTLPASYSGSCETIIDGLAYPTYAVNDDIASTDQVDVYDGLEYNTYTNTTLLTAEDTFTDSEKLLTGVDRPTFMTLEPNSITKLRVYIYIEGQDIDNYDFASIGKKISVNFGFTKERFTEDDIDYDGPDINQGEGPSGSDLTAPVITILGDNPMTVALGGSYVEAGATALDNIDGTVTDDIVTTGTVNEDVAGEYNIVYTVEDAAGNVATKVRVVTVE